ncbi:MAG: type transport system permease protein [Solirubrobacteraceae bacterium]|nr:type transport system permease protein [Solirubrobacteraceae bacterium]
MRWLLVKDLQILRRSPLLVGLLVVYPIAISLLIGLALSRGPNKPRVAFLDEVPVGQRVIKLGAEKVDVETYANQVLAAVTPIRVADRAQALDAVRSGNALAAVIVPSDLTSKLSTGLQSAEVEVVYNGDALAESFVHTTITAQVAQANAQLATKLAQVAGSYVDLLRRGGRISLLGTNVDVLGLTAAKTILDQVLAGLPPGSPTRPKLVPVDRFATLAVVNLGLSKGLFSALSSPIRVHQTLLKGRRTPLDAFAVAVAVTVSLMFVCVLLASGMLALEREENTFTRLTRGLVSPTGLVAEKAVLAAGCAFVVAVAMLLGIGVLVHLDWSRFALWLAAVGVSALAFAALGVAIGSLAREVRAASLLAFLLSLPLAFLALVPGGAVPEALYQAIRVISAVFPFKPALEAIDAALNGTQPGLPISLAHLAGLIVVFGAAARVGLRRFA